MRTLKKVFILYFIAFVFCSESMAQNMNVRVEQVISKDFPELTAYVSVKDKNGGVVSGIAPGLFTYSVDNADVKVQSKIVQLSQIDEKTDYTILISNNGLMEGEPLDFQKNGVLKFVDEMNDCDTVTIYALSKDDGPLCENVLKKDFNPSVINSIEAGDLQPRLYDTVFNIVNKVSQKTDVHKVIVVMSDGRDQDSRWSKKKLFENLDERAIPVYTLGLHVISSATLSALDEMSQITGGSYFYCPSLNSVPSSMVRIIQNEKQIYRISLKLKHFKADDQNHMLNIKIKGSEKNGEGGRLFKAVRHPFPKWLPAVFVVSGVLLAALLFVVYMLEKIRQRKSMGITTRRCSECGVRMKDNWEFCPFCRYGKKQKKEKIK